MNTEFLHYDIEYQPALTEEVVLRAISGHALELVFRQERDVGYSIEDDEHREETFQILHQTWFHRLSLDKPLLDILSYWPILQERTCKCLVVAARTNKDIGAELFVGPDNNGNPKRQNRSILIQLTPELFCNTEPLLQFLRHELLHIVDMLDPEYGYEPNLPRSEFGPTYDRLLQQRYRVIWDLVVDGRLVQSGFLPASEKEIHRKNFLEAFSGPAKDQQTIFEFFFHNNTPRHQELVSFAISPESWFVSDAPKSHTKGLCPLCLLPNYGLASPEARLAESTITRIQEEHPTWDGKQPVCKQCLDLYTLELGDCHSNA